jgi:hypothetical protein
MFSNAFHGASKGPNVRRRAATVLSTTLVAALAALPTATALASAGPVGSGASGSTQRPAPAARRQTTPGELLSAGKLEELLAQLPLSSLSATQLAHYLAGLEGMGALAGLQGLLGHDLGTAGAEGALAEAIEQLKLGNPSATLGELTNVKDLLPSLEGQLAGLLKLLGSPLSAEQKADLEHALGSLDLDQLASSLLGSAQPSEQLAGELSTLAGGLFGELGSGELSSLLGSSLTGGFAAKSERTVAEELHSTPTAVSEALGQTTPPLPETTTMLTAPLTSGGLVGVAPAVKGLAMGLLGDAGAGEGGKGTGEGESGSGSGEGGKGSGEGGSGTGGGSKGSGEGGSGTGQGGNGAGGGSQGGSNEGGHGGQGGSAGGTTIVVTLPSALSSTQAASTVAKHTPGKVRILSYRVSGHAATLVLQVPSAGRVLLAGVGVRSAGAHAAKAERLTLRVSLSKAVVASLRKSRRHRLAVKLTASFKPAAGSGSSATVAVTFA